MYIVRQSLYCPVKIKCLWGAQPGFFKAGGSHYVKQRVLTSFCHLNIIGCLPKKGLQRRWGGSTGTPGPSLAMPLFVLYMYKQTKKFYYWYLGSGWARLSSLSRSENNTEEKDWGWNRIWNGWPIPWWKTSCWTKWWSVGLFFSVTVF